MKKPAAACVLLSLVAVSCASHRTVAGRLAENYTVVTLSAPDLSGVADNGKELLDLYRSAADEADRIYWRQYFGDRDALLSSISDTSARLYAEINYGPWDRIDGKPFLDGYGPRPAGAGFYPADMTAAEFDACEDPDKYSPYTLVVRDGDSLKTVWFHDAYAGSVGRIAEYLQKAADMDVSPSVRRYLLKKIEGLRTDNYYESDWAWLQMNDSRMDLVIGPNETTDDALYGTKASYGAYVLLKNPERTKELKAVATRIPEYQDMLPGNPRFRDFLPGSKSGVLSCDVLYCAGSPNAGHKVIAIKMPYDERVREAAGTRTILFDNVIRKKYDLTVLPVGMTLFEEAHQARLNADAFYWIMVFREISHRLGVEETVTGKGAVASALGASAPVFEKAKTSVLGAYLCATEADGRHLSVDMEKEDVLATFIANTIRSARFGTADPTGVANLAVFNYLVECGALTRGDSGRYDIDYERTWKAVEDLGAEILRVQALGDIRTARSYVEKYGVVTSGFKDDIESLEQEKVPVDIRFNYDF